MTCETVEDTEDDGDADHEGNLVDCKHHAYPNLVLAEAPGEDGKAAGTCAEKIEMLVDGKTSCIGEPEEHLA